MVWSASSFQLPWGVSKGELDGGSVKQIKVIVTLTDLTTSTESFRDVIIFSNSVPYSDSVEELLWAVQKE